MGKLQDDSPILCLGHSSTSKDDKENTKFDESYEMWFDEFNKKSLKVSRLKAAILGL